MLNHTKAIGQEYFQVVDHLTHCFSNNLVVDAIFRSAGIKLDFMLDAHLKLVTGYQSREHRLAK